MTESALCELLACHGSTTNVLARMAQVRRPLPTLPSLRVGGARVSVQNAREHRRAGFRSASLVSLPQNRPSPRPPAHAGESREGVTASRRSRGESLTLEELL